MVAHFHYVLFGTIVFATFAGIYFWFPKMTGRMLDERLGKFRFRTTSVGFHTTFLVVLGASTLPFIWNVFVSYRHGRVVDVDDPWCHGNSLEWAISCPPPRHNFTDLPRIRPERPAFELHYPRMSPRIRSESHIGSRQATVGKQAAGLARQEGLTGEDSRNR